MEAVAAQALAVFQVKLHGAWSNMAWWKVSLPLAAGLQQGILEAKKCSPFLGLPWY